jgi:flagellar assembly protein FliH
MQSLYKVIKNNSVVKDGSKEIVTKFNKDREAKQKEISETNAEMFIDSYENLAKTLIENSRKKSDEILSSAYEEADKASKEAFRKGYEEGMEKGYSEGFNKAYKEAYEDNINKALAEAESIKNNADNVLNAAISGKEKYIKDKELEIKALIINCVESILKREVRDAEGLNNIIFGALSQVKNTVALIIKSKKIHCEEFKKQVDIWKEQLPFNGDIFFIPDDSIEEGSAIIERDNGKTLVSIDIAMEKLREIINTVE